MFVVMRPVKKRKTRNYVQMAALKCSDIKGNL